MTTTEAKFILQSYRHSGADASDPVFTDSLEHARRDPELSKWLAEEVQLDAAISRKLQSVPVPADLKATILAGQKVIKPAIWSRRSWLAAAACFLILATALSIWLVQRPKHDLVAFRRDMTDFLTMRLDHLDVNTADMKEIHQWLTQRDAHGDFVLPEGLKELAGIGCRILDWNGQKVTLICFKESGPKEVHLFVIDRAAFPKLPKDGPPEFARSGAWTTASWTRGDKVYMLAGMGDRSWLWKYL